MVALRSHIRSQITWIAMMDLACLVAGGAVGIFLRFGHEEIAQYVFEHLEGWLLLFGGVLLANYLAGSYRLQYTFSRFNLVVAWMFSMAFVLLMLSMTSYAWLAAVLGRGVLLLSLAVYSALALILKLLVYRRLFRRPVFVCRTAIVGAGPRAAQLKRMIENDLVLPSHTVVAYLRLADGGPAPADGPVMDGTLVLNVAPDDLESVLESLGANLLVLSMDDPRDLSRLYPILRRLRFNGLEVLTPLAVAEIYRGITPLDLVDEDVLMDASLESGLPMVWRAKRLCDIAISLLAIALMAPLAAAIAGLVKLTAPRSPVFYTQLRAGQFGRVFRIYKFRTMREDAERDTGPVWTGAGDPRVTWIGGFLRRFRLDELPQMINILKGEMSLVGPRPERPEMVALLEKEIPFYGERANIPPGLTGWAQVRYPYGQSVADAARKLEFDLYYMKHLSLSLDLQIVLGTLRIVLLGKERVVD